MPRFDNSFNMGHILLLLTWIGTAAAAWATHQAAVRHIEEKLMADARVIETHATEINVLKIQHATIQATLNGISTTVDKIDKKLNSE